MKTLKQHIAESKALHQNVNIQENLKFKINRNTKVYEYQPKSWDELRQIIVDRYEEQGPGTKYNPIDFNDIDVSGIDTFFNDPSDAGLFEGIPFEYIDISDWNVSNVKYMSNMFFKCQILELVGDLSKWDVSSVENMAGMFYACKSLKSVGNISKWNIINVKDMGDMFTDSGITNIPNWYKK